MKKNKKKNPKLIIATIVALIIVAVTVAILVYRENKAKANEITYDQLYQDIIDKIVFRIRSYEEGYPLTKSGKRSVRELELEGISQIDKCYTKENNQIICLTDKDALKLTK